MYLNKSLSHHTLSVQHSAAGTLIFSWVFYSWHTKHLSKHQTNTNLLPTLSLSSPSFLPVEEAEVQQFSVHAAKRGTFTTATSVHIFF